MQKAIPHGMALRARSSSLSVLVARSDDTGEAGAEISERPMQGRVRGGTTLRHRGAGRANPERQRPDPNDDSPQGDADRELHFLHVTLPQ